MRSRREKSGVPRNGSVQRSPLTKARGVPHEPLWKSRNYKELRKLFLGIVSPRLRRSGIHCYSSMQLPTRVAITERGLYATNSGQMKQFSTAASLPELTLPEPGAAATA